MKTLSVKNPLSYLICMGIKDVENRSWTTKYRGKLAIHSSGFRDLADFSPEDFPQIILSNFKKIKMNGETANTDNCEYKDIINKIVDIQIMLNNYYDNNKELYFLHQAIIGECELVDITKKSDSPFAIKNKWHWILKNPVLYEKPIKNIRGKLKLFER